MIKIKHIKRIFEGMLMGGANVIPGVSGGTMALITGIYERLIHSINTIPLSAPFFLLKGDYREFGDRIKSVDHNFLIPLIIGILIGTLSLARFMEYLLDTVPAITYSFFFGLILAGLGVIYKYIDEVDIRIVIWGIFGFLFAFFLVGLPKLQTEPNLFIIFICGMAAIISMILPGLSGAFILIFLQQYDFMLNALNDLNIPVIVTFITGGAVGLFTFSKLLEYLLNKYESAIMALLFGLMVGGLRAPGEEVIDINPPLYQFIVPAIIGAVLVIVIEYRYVSPK